jgi:hypothetical protein
MLCVARGWSILSAEDVLRQPLKAGQETSVGQLDDLLFRDEDTGQRNGAAGIAESGKSQNGDLAKGDLIEIRRQMLQAQVALDTADLNHAVQLQQEIVHALELELAPASSGSAAGGPSTQRPEAQSDSEKVHRQDETPASAAADRNVKDSAAVQRHRELLERVWGHLPPTARQQMMTTARPEFLPKYEQQIERYFLLLSNRPTGSSAKTP